MDIIVPITIGEAEVASSNVILDEGLDEWSSTRDYEIGDEVISTTAHQVYRALVASGPSGAGYPQWDAETDYAIDDKVTALNGDDVLTFEAIAASGPSSAPQDPLNAPQASDYWQLITSGTSVDPDAEWAKIDDPLDLSNTAPVHWDRLYATNPYRLFDQSPTQACVNVGSIDVTLQTGTFVQGLAFFGVSADEIVITVRDEGEEVYSFSKNMADNSAVVDWWTYYFQPIRETEQLVVTDLPPFGDAEIQIEIKRPNGSAQCGEIIAGGLYNLGRTKTEPKIKMLDYSKIEEDQYGNLTTAVRGATQQVTYEVWLPGLNTESVFNQIKALRGAQKVVWIGDAESRLSLINYGYVSSLEMRVAASTPTYSDAGVLVEKANTFATIETKGIL